MSNFSPTPYSDVNAILAELLTAVQPILGPQFIGMYLHGSLAAGDFNPNRSDIDFVVATTTELANETVSTLAAIHAQIRAGGSYWATRLEGDYIPLAALRRYDPARACYPHLGDDGHFAVEQHGGEAIIQFHILRENGVVLAGPALDSVIDPITPGDLQYATRDILHGWWQSRLANPVHLAANDYQAYAILTMCRLLYTLQLGEIVSKPAVARWAMGKVDGRFTSLIQLANAWQNGMPFDKLDETIDFIRYTLIQSS